MKFLALVATALIVMTIPPASAILIGDPDATVDGNINATGTMMGGVLRAGELGIVDVFMRDTHPAMSFFETDTLAQWYLVGASGDLSFRKGTTDPSNAILQLRQNGRVGILTTAPRTELDVNGTISGKILRSGGAGIIDMLFEDTHPTISMLETDTNQQWYIVGAAGALSFRRNTTDASNTVLHFLPNGKIGLGTTNPTTAFDVKGEAAVDVLNITGGTDLSERFNIADEPQPGMVVVIDAANPGDLKVATKAYDRTVAGIVSGAGGVKPGMLMGQKGLDITGEHPVALTGRVYCYVDATVHGVVPGDLLTTSDTPGHAMKVTDYARAQGAILGKAMTALDKGQKGLVLVLVSLQ